MGTTFQDERARRILSRNVRAFLAAMEISENALAQKCKISQKQVNNITQGRTGCGIDALAEIARVFDCQPWMLLVDGLHSSVNRHRRLARVVDRYVSATDGDQELIDAVAAKAVQRGVA